MTVKGPVFIGNGEEISKKEYAVSWEESKVYVMDRMRLYNLLNSKRLVNEYVDFSLKNRNKDLGEWLFREKVGIDDCLKCSKYSLDFGDAVVEDRSMLAINAFIKDAYGLPYVPGSSIKGMLRTVLLAHDINNNITKYRNVKSCTKQEIDCSYNEKANKNFFLSKPAKEMETIAYNILDREGTKKTDAVNDIMSGVIISDSEPLSMDDLILCRPFQLHTDGSEKKLNVLREALRPGTIVKFKITIDTSLCKITLDEIKSAIAYFGQMYNEVFLRKYKGLDTPSRDSVWLGGGVGFVSKTEIYPLYGHHEGVSTTVNIFRATGVPANHKHSEDIKKGVSPHICKVTYYKGHMYQMGLCSIKFNEK